MLLGVCGIRVFRGLGILWYVLFGSQSAQVGLSLPGYLSVPGCSSSCPFSTHAAAFFAFAFFLSSFFLNQRPPHLHSLPVSHTEWPRP